MFLDFKHPFATYDLFISGNGTNDQVCWANKALYSFDVAILQTANLEAARKVKGSVELVEDLVDMLAVGLKGTLAFDIPDLDLVIIEWKGAIKKN